MTAELTSAGFGTGMLWTCSEAMRVSFAIIRLVYTHMAGGGGNEGVTFPLQREGEVPRPARSSPASPLRPDLSAEVNIGKR